MTATETATCILNALDFPGGLEQCAHFYHAAWGKEDNYSFFRDAFHHSSRTPKSTPRFYVLLLEQQIVGCYGIVTMDFVSRQDLHPWFAGFFVSESHRGRGFGARILAHAAAEGRRIGVSCLYLTTDLAGYYERHGWERMEDAYDLSGEPTRIYRLRIG